jgi:hypothetical protein
VGTQWRPPRGPDDLDDDQRARIRYEVLRSVRPLRRTLRDRIVDGAYDVVAILALPAPHLVRALVVAVAIVSIVGTATVASADALPDEPLYGVKLASEQVRLALAGTPEDRASVRLSMAEHRLAEAVRLVQDGRAAEAVTVTTAYGTHLANAAAELATVERLNVASRPVVEQLRQRLAEQQHQAAEMAARFVADPATDVGAQLFRTIASFAPALTRGSTVSEGIADHAASVAGQLAAVAERLAERAASEARPDEEEDEEPQAAIATPAAPPAAAAPQAPPAPRAAATLARATQRPAPVPTVAQRAQPPARATAAIGQTGPEVAKPTATAKPSARPTVDPKKAASAEAAKAAAEKAKVEAEKARAAAEKAKQAAKRTASPKPTPRPSPKR